MDSHADTIHAAVVTDRGGHIADAEFPTTVLGYTAVLAFLTAHGTVTSIGVEGIPPTAPASKARTATLNQIGHALIGAPGDIRAKYGALQGDNRTQALARIRPTGDGVHIAFLTALKTLAKRVQSLTEEHHALTVALDALVTELNPGLRATYGVGPTPPPSC
ncbi:hypothetical protein [Kitasatospora sp. NPDC057015]|uniref:hypothetical protein n=1 Tax=Kitasatospora sp. NPDC057015 TaxID=3346001 RepID=UPI003625B218